MIAVSCQACGHEARVPDSAAGARGHCRRCGSVVAVPGGRRTQPAPGPIGGDGGDDGGYQLAAPRAHPTSAPRSAAAAAATNADADAPHGIVRPPRGAVAPSLLATLACTAGGILLGIGGFYTEVYDGVSGATHSAGAAAAACAVMMLAGGAALGYGYALCARHAVVKPWNSTRRISLILAALWTVVGAWMVTAQGVTFASGTVNGPLVAMILPTLALWATALYPAPPT